MATTGPYRTQDDLIRLVLKRIGVFAAGQALDPEDYTYVQEDIDSIFRTIAALEICYVPDSNNIPALWFSPLADIFAGEMASKFGLTDDDQTKLIAIGLGASPQGSGAAAMKLRAINRGRPTYEPLRVEYM